MHMLVYDEVVVNCFNSIWLKSSCHRTKFSLEVRYKKVIIADR